MTCNGFPQAEPLSGRGIDLGKACVWHVQRVYFASVYWDMLSQRPVKENKRTSSTGQGTVSRRFVLRFYR
jgi:hypothetical protein